MSPLQWAVVVVLVGVSAGAAYEAFQHEEAMRHQDISCTAGVYSFFAEDVAVKEGRDKIVITYPDGRRRAVLDGTCEWVPHDPDGKYEPAETQSWQGPEPDRGVRWASL